MYTHTHPHMEYTLLEILYHYQVNRSKPLQKTTTNLHIHVRGATPHLVNFLYKTSQHKQTALNKTK